MIVTFSLFFLFSHTNQVARFSSGNLPVADAAGFV